jgi:hypothetical protein
MDLLELLLWFSSKLRNSRNKETAASILAGQSLGQTFP